jgi:uncharacterized protein (TIGR02145 family)
VYKNPQPMKSKLFLALFLLFFVIAASAQKELLNLSFTAVNDDVNVQLDSIRVINLTQGIDTLLVWPDTIVSLEILPYDRMLYVGYSEGLPVGIYHEKPDNPSFQLFPCVPNPVDNEAKVSLYIAHPGIVELSVRDMMGKEVLSIRKNLEEGLHSFCFVPSEGEFFFLTACWNGFSSTIKIITTGRKKASVCSLTQHDISGNPFPEKAAEVMQNMVTLESGILDTAGVSGIHRFQFATNIPCPGIPTITYEGRIYHTVQIGSQCWMKENLNVGVMIPATQEMLDNGIKEKYCFDNNPANCLLYGGLYQWFEVMQYFTPNMYQGICPSGWHIPSDEEWMVLEGVADSEYGIGDPVWENTSARGFDASFNLKSNEGWIFGGNGSDLFGFSALPGGTRDYTANFFSAGEYSYWWTSTYSFTSYGVNRIFNALNNNPIRNPNDYLGNGNSVRCLKDD